TFMSFSLLRARPALAEARVLVAARAPFLGAAAGTAAVCLVFFAALMRGAPPASSMRPRWPAPCHGAPGSPDPPPTPAPHRHPAGFARPGRASAHRLRR